MTSLTPESLHAEILSKKEDIIKGVVSSLIQQVSTSTYYGIQNDISSEVAKIVKEQMLEEIRAAVVAAKPDILAGVTTAIAKCSAEIGAAMVKKVATNMEGYKGGQVLKALFD